MSCQPLPERPNPTISPPASLPRTGDYYSGPGFSGGGSGMPPQPPGPGGDCHACLTSLCVTRDPYTGRVTGIYYQTEDGLVAVPDCGQGSEYDYASGPSEGSDSQGSDSCSGIVSYGQPGTYTFTAPCDGTYLIECWGGGGAGCGGNNATAGGGGGGGSYARSILTLTAGSYTVVVGSGGGSVPGGPGGNGGNSIFGANLVVGAGGFGATTNGGAGPGTGNVGQVIHVGGSATAGFWHPWGGGGGGASGHPTGPGASGGISGPSSGGAGGAPATDGGGGGAGGDPDFPGLTGTWPGGGGGGGGSSATTPTPGGPGAHGRVRITWPA